MKHKNLLLAALAMAACCAQSIAAPKKGATLIDRVEPCNWWTDMRNTSLQLMLHGNGIASADVVINHPTVSAVRTIKTGNANYLFVDMEIPRGTKPGTVAIELRRNGKTIATVPYELREREPQSAQRQGFDASDAMYLVMPDRFANGNPNNDNMPGMVEQADRNAPYGRHGGDLRGIIDNLDYIADLGMTALWVNPVQENNMPSASYHGYAITDYYALDARLGTMAEYKELADKCHQKGIKLIMDMVFNHCGTNHWWMNDLPCPDWVFQWDGEYVQSSYRLSTVADPHVSCIDKRIATEGWFDKTMADMNLRNPLVKNYLIQNSIWWIETIGLDGIRQDTYPYPDKHAMAEWNVRVREEYPNFNIVGEAWISQASKLCYWQKDFPNKDGFNSELPTIMDFPLQEAICAAFTSEPGWDSGIIKLYNALADDHLYPNTFNMLVFGENHDVGRLLNMVGNNIDNLKLATAFLATVRGIPQLYSGTEVLMSGNGFEGHAYIREDFPGGWTGDSISYLNAALRPQQPDDMYQYTANLFRYRKQSKPLQWGELTHFLPQNEAYVFFRTLGNEAVMVILNNNTQEQTIATSRFAEIMAGYTAGTDIVSGTALTDLSNITIGGKQAMVIELKR